MVKNIVLASLMATLFVAGATSGHNLPTRRNTNKPKRTALKSDGTSKIEHVVVLMLENRAFDHMLGWMGQWGVPVDGLTGKEFNTIYKNDGSSYRAYVNGDCPHINPFDPLHNVPNVTNALMDGSRWLNPAPMSGFAQSHYVQGFETPENVMTGFTPDRVPAISTLAKNFAVFDGSTFPNRFHQTWWLLRPCLSSSGQRAQPGRNHRRPGKHL